MATFKNTFRRHDLKKSKRNLDRLNVRHGIYDLTDRVEKQSRLDAFCERLEMRCSQERLIGICIGLSISAIPLLIINIVLWW